MMFFNDSEQARFQQRFNLFILQKHYFHAILMPFWVKILLEIYEIIGNRRSP